MLLEITGVTKTYRTGPIEVHALRGVDLSIRRGEFVSIMGPSGSGKSTLLNVIGCLDRPTAGEYLFEGRRVTKLRESALADLRNEVIGFVFQTFHLLPRLTARQNVELPLIYRGVPRGARVKAAEQALAVMGLQDRMGHRPGEMSGGQQQRVAIARALVTRPRLILADEPTGNLDTRNSEEIMALFQRLNDDGLTIIQVTHDPEMAEHGKRTIILRDGRITDDDPVAERRIAAHILADLNAEEEKAG